MKNGKAGNVNGGFRPELYAGLIKTPEEVAFEGEIIKVLERLRATTTDFVLLFADQKTGQKGCVFAGQPDVLMDAMASAMGQDVTFRHLVLGSLDTAMGEVADPTQAHIDAPASTDNVSE